MKELSMKYLALDIGNVLCGVDMTKFTDKLIHYGYFEDFDNAWEFCKEIQHRLDLGHSNIKCEINKLGNKYSEELIDAWMSIVIPIKEVDDILVEMLNNDHKIALLSNVGTDHAPHIEQLLSQSYSKCYKHFSCDVGERKPSSKYFIKFLNLNPKYSGGLYIDDRLENLETGMKYFDKNIHFAIDSFKTHTEAYERFNEIMITEGYL
jgi:FMN phosphatase YigB (HAD superfamily)